MREWSLSDKNLLVFKDGLFRFIIVDSDPYKLKFDSDFASKGPAIHHIGGYGDGTFSSFRVLYFKYSSSMPLGSIDKIKLEQDGSIYGSYFYTSLYRGTIFDNYLNINSFPRVGFACGDSPLVLHDDLGIFSPLPVVSHNLTVNYQYEDGSTAAPIYTHSFPVGDSYSVGSPAIDGYTPDVDTVSGVMSDSDISVTVTYRKTVPDPVLYDLTIDYLYGNGAPASVKYNAQFSAGDNYDVLSPLISGYSPDRSRVVGVMPEKDVIETVVYSKDEPPPVDPPIDPPSRLSIRNMLLFIFLLFMKCLILSVLM